MIFERTVGRFSSYFRGWCQAFGEHQQLAFEPNANNWLLADDQVGLILTDDLRRLFYLDLLGDKKAVPTLRLSKSYVELSGSRYPLVGERDIQGMDALIALLQKDQPTYLYLTYHLYYPPRTRIVTFSKKTPLGILYKEMRPLTLAVI